MHDYYIYEYRLTEDEPKRWQLLLQWFVSPVELEHLLLSRQIQSVCIPSKPESFIDYQFSYSFPKNTQLLVHQNLRASLEACPIYYVVNPKQELILLSPRQWELEYKAPTFLNWVFDHIFHRNPTSYLLAFFHPDDAHMYLKSVLVNPYERDKNSFVEQGDLFSFLKLNRTDLKVILVPPLRQLCKWSKFEGTPVFRVQWQDHEWLFFSKKDAQQFIKNQLSCKITYDVISLESVLESDLDRQARCTLVPLSL
jgi:hypothetical protein